MACVHTWGVEFLVGVQVGDLPSSFATSLHHINFNKERLLIAMNNSGYDEQMFDRVLQGVDGPLEQTKEVLLRRGFLVKSFEDTLYLAKGSHREDIEMLRRFLTVEEEENWSQDACAKITPSANENSLFRLFVTRPQNGMTGPFDWGGWVSSDWASFQRLHFGIKVPVRVLDPGIALLVKAMPLVGLHTVMSCDGHTEKPPIIHLFSKSHLDWARVALPQFLSPDDDFVRQWVFRQDSTSWMGYEWLLSSEGCGPDPEAQYALHGKIQCLARNIMFSGLAPRARKCKQQLNGPEDLENPECFMFSK